MGSRVRFAAELTYMHRLDRVWLLFRSRAGGHNTARCLHLPSVAITSSTAIGLAAPQLYRQPSRHTVWHPVSLHTMSEPLSAECLL